jgi:hypothetical protein
MSIISILIILVVIGVLMWLVNSQLGQFIAQPWLKIINIVAIILTVLWLLSLFFPGVLGGSQARITPIR